MFGSATTASGGSGSSRITSVTFEAVTANSITLSWTALNSADRFKLYYTTDGETFLPVPNPTGYSMVT